MFDQKTVVALAHETGAATATIYRWAQGVVVNATTDYALRSACRKLKIPIPSRLTQPSVEAEPTGTEG